MKLTEEEKIDLYAKQRLHYTYNTLLLYECKWTSIACGYNVKQKGRLTKKQRKG